MNNKVRKYVAKSVSLKDIYYDLVLSKKKTSTIRYGYVFFNDIETTLTFGSKPTLNVVIKKLDYSKTYGTIDNKDSEKDGYESLEDLKIDIKKYYPEIKEDSPLTIIHFDVI